MAYSNGNIPTVDIITMEPVTTLVTHGTSLGLPPTGATYAGIFALECIMQDINGTGIYEMTGTVAVPTWTLITLGSTTSGGSAYDVKSAANFAALAGTSLTLSAFTAPSIFATGNTGETTMAGVAGRYGSGSDTVAAAPYAQAIIDVAALKATLIALPGIDISTNASALDAYNAGAGAGVFVPGVYTTAAAIGVTASKTLTLNGAGDYVFISTGGAITFGANDIILLTNGATAARVFWVAATDLSTTGANSSLVGNFLVRDATVASTNIIQGRILASRAVVVDGTATSFALPLGTTGAGVALASGSTFVGSLGGIAVATPVSHLAKYAGKITWSGSGASLATTVTGVLSTDIVLVTVQTAATQTGYVASAAPTTNTITIVLSTANTSNDAVIAYTVLRAV